MGRVENELVLETAIHFGLAHEWLLRDSRQQSLQMFKFLRIHIDKNDQSLTARISDKIN